MLSTFRKISFLNRIFNIRGNEWSRIRVSLMLKFFYRTGFVIGWTLLMAMFVSNYGIDKLPVLFVLNAVFTMLGSFFFSVIVDRFDRNKLMVVVTILAALMLFLATVFFERNIVLFFALLIVTVSVLLSQLRMMISGFVEDLFNSIESERTFPFIEAADTVGGIVGGVLILLLSSFYQPHQFVFFWGVVLLLIVPVVVFRNELCSYDEVHLEKRSYVKDCSGVVSRLKMGLSSKSIFSYVKGLFLVVFLQWLLAVLLDFQYTKAVFNNVDSVIVDTAGFEHAFIHDLGALFILFSFSALLMQLFFAGRLINYLGVVGSMILHTVVSFLSLLGLFLNFNFYTAVLAKNNFTATSILNTNAYHSSYYAIREKFRVQVRELLEGVVRPLGAIGGTMMIFLVESVFSDGKLNVALNVLMIVVVCLMIFVNYRQKSRYTRVATSDLRYSKDLGVRFNAVDVLAQKGHGSDAANYLCSILRSEKEPVSLKVRVLSALGEANDVVAIGSMSKMLDEEDYVIKEATLEALDNFSVLKRDRGGHQFVKDGLIKKLENFYRKESNKVLLAKTVRLLSGLSTVSTTRFLVSILKSRADIDKTEVIYALAKYRGEGKIKFLRKFLKSASHNEKIYAAIGLYEFSKYREKCLKIIEGALGSELVNVRAYGIFAVGDLGLKGFAEECKKGLESDNEFVRMHSALALLKLGYKGYVKALVELFFYGSHENVEKLKILLKDIDSNLAAKVTESLKEMVFREVKKIMEENKVKNIEGFSKSQLQTLLWFYKLIGEYDEVEVICDVIAVKDK